jgi:hypothetical protein
MYGAAGGSNGNWGGQTRGGAHPQTAEIIKTFGERKSASVPIPKISVFSTPEGADIDIDGSFVGNTPSVVELAPGEHVVIVTKSGYKAWQRKLKVSGGEIKLTAELQK